MSARPQPHPAFERRMLERPPTHDTVGTPPLERFRCLDIGGGLILSRAACASRFVATTRDGRSSSVGSQSLAMGPCRGCPTGAAHAAEQRAGTLVSITSGQDRGTVAKPGRVGPIRPGSFATRPAPVVEAPAAVVPAKRPSVAPALTAAETATTKTLAHADAQHHEPERAPVSPVEIEPPAPPSGEQVSTGQRPTPMLSCARCPAIVERRNVLQRYCAPCAEVLSAERASARRLKSERKTATRAPAGHTHGDVTDSARGWARRLGITPKAFRQRLRAGLPPEQLFATGKLPTGGDTTERRARALDAVTHPTTRETLTIRQWAARLGCAPETLVYRIGEGWPVERVLVAPSRGGGRKPGGGATAQSGQQQAPERPTTSVGVVATTKGRAAAWLASAPEGARELLKLAAVVVDAERALANARHIANEAESVLATAEQRYHERFAEIVRGVA